MRRRKLLVALVGLAVVVAAGVVGLWPRAERVTRVNCRHVTLGMTLAEVEAILGPPGDYTTGPTCPECEPWNFPPVTFVDRDAIREWRYWEGDTASLSVSFDSQRKVLDTYYLPEQRWDKSMLETLLWRLKRQWRRWFPE